MKKFALKATAAAAALLGAGVAFAGSVTVTPGVPTYAVEALQPTTVVTLPAVGYDTGAGTQTYKLSEGVNYRIIFELPAGLAWSGAGTLTPSTSAAPSAETVGAGAACAPVTFSGQTDNQLAFGCSVVNATTPGAALPAQFTLAASTMQAGSLTTAGTVVKLTKVATQSIEGATNWDTVNNTDYVKSDKAITLVHLDQSSTASSIDTETTTDAEYTAGGALKPLQGFVVTGDDLALKAQASVEIDNNSNNFMLPNLSGPFDMRVSGGDYAFTNAVTFKVKDSRKFQGLATNGLVLTSSTLGSAILTPNAATGEATLTVDGDDVMFPTQGNSATFDLSYTATGNDSLGTTREIDLVGQVSGGGQVVGLSDGVNNWWKWGTNGMILKFAAISYKKNTPSWIQLTNYSTQADASYTATCYADNGSAAGTPGVITKDTTQRLELQDVCGSATKAQSVEMVFATKAGNVNGAVVRKNASTGDVTYINASAGNQN